ncbi:hypothetical protein DHEL01_v208583 [Diaporthe helianthi]|uniref:Uncharacterized protein n=1 Tax=Diaporthe helianthi TaxID=158607 RepID=A0A2P5HRX8_DIAHE|nr:hypothetical protein DHEL01_v208583 [Diaporthe helianthi]
MVVPKPRKQTPIGYQVCFAGKTMLVAGDNMGLGFEIEVKYPGPGDEVPVTSCDLADPCRLGEETAVWVTVLSTALMAVVLLPNGYRMVQKDTGTPVQKAANEKATWDAARS